MSRPSIPASTLDRFIEAIRIGSTLKEACAAASIGRTTAYDYRRRDPEFAARWDDANAEGLDTLEGELYARAMDREDPGSGPLLLFLLARRRPEVFGRCLEVDVRVEATGSTDEFRAALALVGIPLPSATAEAE